MKRFVPDKSGQKYRIKVNKYPYHFLIYELYELIGQHECVGCIRWQLISPKQMNIGDIHIRNDRDPPDGPVCPGYCSIEPEAARKNYRGKGLGTELLKLAIDYAREKRVKFICGSVTKEDNSKTRFILEWYERHGAKVVRYQGHNPDPVASICWELD